MFTKDTMAIEYLKKPLTYTAIMVAGAVVVNHPGGEATVRHYPDGHVEIASSFHVDSIKIDSRARLSRQFSLGSMTMFATDLIEGIKAI